MRGRLQARYVWTATYNDCPYKALTSFRSPTQRYVYRLRGFLHAQRLVGRTPVYDSMPPKTKLAL